jgi:rare lipoprotein A
MRVRASLQKLVAVGACAGLSLLLAHCSSSSHVDARYGVSASERVVGPGEPVPKGGGTFRVGSPYVVAGQTYVPQDDPNYRAEGLATISTAASPPTARFSTKTASPRPIPLCRCRATCG